MGAKVSAPKAQPAHGVTVVFVELPEVGAALQAGQCFGSVESVKAVEDLLAPVGASSVAGAT